MRSAWHRSLAAAILTVTTPTCGGDEGGDDRPGYAGECDSFEQRCVSDHPDYPGRNVIEGCNLSDGSDKGRWDFPIACEPGEACVFCEYGQGSCSEAEAPLGGGTETYYCAPEECVAADTVCWRL